MSVEASYDSSPIGRALNSNNVEFLKIDLETALTFATIALESPDDPDKKTRNQARARQAYDFVIERQRTLRINETDATEIAEKLKELKFALAQLGEKF
jgi:hypothetical protein